ncbi:Mfs1.1 [Trametes cingulata]|nr:Mfs1.1 [Trametes cingulata]
MSTSPVTPTLQDTSTSAPASQSCTTTQPARKGVRFWIILLSLLSGTFFSVLEAYAVSTALPTIVSDLRSGQFVWVASAYALASTALLPLSGGLAEAFGRRAVILGSLAVFILGSALSGAAQSMNMLIAGRVVHGAGSGGILTLSQIILSDLVTLQERGAYNGLFGLMWALGGGVGPIVGGALAHHTRWRWIFYLNVPAGGVIAGVLLLILRSPRGSLSQKTFREAFERLDCIGNILVIGASCSCAIALTWGGVQFPWQSPRVIVPLCVAALGFGIWALYEWRFCAFPVISLGAFINITLLYYLPVYYQACKDASPTASGIDLFGLCFSTGPMSIITGISIGKTKAYRVQLWMGWCLVILGVGLMSMITEDTDRAASIGFQVVSGVGIGIIYSATYFPVLAPLPISSTAFALSFFVFVRTFAQIWGVTIGGALLQNELSRRLPAAVKDSIPGIGNVAYAVIPLIPTMRQPEKDLSRKAFAESLALVWRILIAIAGVGLLVSLLMRGLPLHTQRDENWAINPEEARMQEQEADDAEKPQE